MTFDRSVTTGNLILKRPCAVGLRNPPKINAKSEAVRHLVAENLQNVCKNLHAKVSGHFALFRNVSYDNN